MRRANARRDEAIILLLLDTGLRASEFSHLRIGDVARMRLVMRRVVTLTGDPIYRTDDLEVDLARRCVTISQKEIALTPTEFDLIKALAQYAGRVMTHRQLIQQVWGAGYADADRLLRVNIANLRKKNEANPSKPEYLITELGIGYRLASE